MTPFPVRRSSWTLESLHNLIRLPKNDSQYSLATIAYYLLSGCLPYVGKSQREMFSQLLSQPPIPLNSARKGCSVPASVEAVIMKALSRNPSERYPDVVSFATALRSAIDTPASEAGRGSLFSRMKSLIKRNDPS